MHFSEQGRRQVSEEQDRTAGKATSERWVMLTAPGKDELTLAPFYDWKTEAESYGEVGATPPLSTALPPPTLSWGRGSVPRAAQEPVSR